MEHLTMHVLLIISRAHSRLTRCFSFSTPQVLYNYGIHIQGRGIRGSFPPFLFKTTASTVTTPIIVRARVLLEIRTVESRLNGQ